MSRFRPLLVAAATLITVNTTDQVCADVDPLCHLTQLQYSTVQYSTVQYSTAQVCADPLCHLTQVLQLRFQTTKDVIISLLL